MEDIVKKGAVLDSLEHGRSGRCDNIAWMGLEKCETYDMTGGGTAEVECCWAGGGPGIRRVGGGGVDAIDAVGLVQCCCVCHVGGMLWGEAMKA